MSVLDEIVAAKREVVRRRSAELPLRDVRALAEAAPPTRNFLAAMTAAGLSVIAEIKRRSPAKGTLHSELDPALMAQVYEQGGASALSVLTDEQYFHGSDSDLVAARQVTRLPVLRKDFTIEPYQVYEARAIGADAILLIVRALRQPRLTELLELAAELSLMALVEVHAESELDRAIEAGARLIGVNNRNLDTLDVDLGTSLRLRTRIPPGVVPVSESGIKSVADAARLAQLGYQGVLIGEALVTSRDPGALLREIRRAGLPQPVVR
jgi:indole-3-glycerol phosphate synthase